MINNKKVIQKMIDYCQDISAFMERFDNNYNKYCKDKDFQYSCNMCIIQIGELVNRLSDEFIEKYNNIPWHAIKAMRNLHAHDYESVDLNIVWNTLNEDIPALKLDLIEILNKEF